MVENHRLFDPASACKPRDFQNIMLAWGVGVPDPGVGGDSEHENETYTEMLTRLTLSGFHLTSAPPFCGHMAEIHDERFRAHPELLRAGNALEKSKYDSLHTLGNGVCARVLDDMCSLLKRETLGLRGYGSFKSTLQRINRHRKWFVLHCLLLPVFFFVIALSNFFLFHLQLGNDTGKGEAGHKVVKKLRNRTQKRKGLMVTAGDCMACCFLYILPFYSSCMHLLTLNIQFL